MSGWLALAGLTVGIGAALFRAFVATKLWLWFVVPLGIKPISFWWAYGLIVLVMLMRESKASDYKPKPKIDQEEMQIANLGVSVGIALGSAVALFVGYIVKAWI